MNPLNLSFSGWGALVVALAAAGRYPRLDPRFRPFCIWAALNAAQVLLFPLWEPILFSIASKGWLLAGSMLMFFQLRQWGLFRSANDQAYYTVQLLLVVCWLAEMLMTRLTGALVNFPTLSSAAQVVGCIHLINRIAFESGRPVHRDPVVLGCMGWLWLSAFALLIGMIALFGADGPAVYGVFAPVYGTIFILVQFLFLNALLWMPHKRRFLLRF